MKRFFSLLLALMLLVGSAVAESATEQEDRAFTADEQAYDAYLDIAYVYDYGVKYLEELGRIWDITLEKDSISTLSKMSYSDLFYDSNSSEKITSIISLYTIKYNHSYSTDEITSLLFKTNDFPLVEKTDLVWIILELEEDAKYLQSKTILKGYLDNAMGKIRTLMKTNRDYPFLADIQSYYKDAVLLYDYFSEFNDNYANFSIKKESFIKSNTSWKIDFEFIFDPADFSYVTKMRDKTETERLGEIYKRATNLENSGNYAEALELYWDSYPYNGSSAALERCNKALLKEKEEKNKERYQEAYSKEESGDYSSALIIYEELDGYKDSNARAEVCREKQTQQAFEGKWSWVASGLLNQNVYYHAYNPYDAYFTIDFDKMTITQKFESSTTQFSKAHKFKIVSPTVISCEAFRGEYKTWYFHITEDGNNLALTLDASRTPVGEISMRRVD